MRYARIGLFLSGVVLLGVLIAETDPAAIFASIGRLSWRLGIVLVFPVSLVMVLDTLGWRFAFRRAAAGFPTLAGARLAGEAFNMVTPTAALGGEVVKVWLLRGHVPGDESAASVIVAKTTITIGQALFLLVGIVVAPRAMAADSALLRAMQWVLLIEVLALAAFVVAQMRGLLDGVGRSLARLGPSMARRHRGLRRVDEALARFYVEEPGRVALSILLHFAAWLLGIVETAMILAFLGVPVSLGVATVIEAFAAAIRIATFFVPASIGALEGGFAVTFTAVGLAPATGIAFGLVRRLREAAWIAAGLLVFAAMRPAARDVPS